MSAAGPGLLKQQLLVIGGGLLLVLPMLVVLGMGFGFDPHKIDSPLVGLPAPVFELPALSDQQPVKLASLQGKPAVINFWATWCASCPMEHPGLVGVTQRQRQLERDLSRLATRERAAAIKQRLERLPLDQIHDEVGPPLPFSRVMHGDQVRVTELGEGQPLAPEPPPLALACLASRQENLDRQVAWEGRVPGAIDHPHPPPRNLPKDLVVPKLH